MGFASAGGQRLPALPTPPAPALRRQAANTNLLSGRGRAQQQVMPPAAWGTFLPPQQGVGSEDTGSPLSLAFARRLGGDSTLGGEELAPGVRKIWVQIRALLFGCRAMGLI